MESVINIEQKKSMAQKAVEEEIRKAENIISYYTVRKETFDPLLLDLESLIGEFNLTLCHNSIDISRAGNRDCLNNIFRVLRNHGFEPDSRPKDEKLSSFSTFFHNKEGMAVWLSFSSTVCKRVQVGTKMVEQPVWEVVCDE